MQNNNQQDNPAAVAKKLNDIESGILAFLNLVSTVTIKLNVDISSDCSEYGQSAPVMRAIIADLPNQAALLKDIQGTITELKNAIN